MRDFKYKMGDKVRILAVKGNSDTSSYSKNRMIGKIGVVSAVYDPSLTPCNYPKCEYRISLIDAAPPITNCDTAYVLEGDIELVKTVKSYCFKKGEEFHWFSSSKAKKGYTRVSGMDHIFEVGLDTKESVRRTHGTYYRD